MLYYIVSNLSVFLWIIYRTIKYVKRKSTNKKKKKLLAIRRLYNYIISLLFDIIIIFFKETRNGIGIGILFRLEFLGGFLNESFLPCIMNFNACFISRVLIDFIIITRMIIIINRHLI